MHPWVIAFDISTKPGYAIFHQGKLLRYGTLFALRNTASFGPYPENYVLFAENVVQRIRDEVIVPVLQGGAKIQEIAFVAEETTPGRSNYSQKNLEYIHFLLVQLILRGYKGSLGYIRDGVWKRICGATQNKAERNHNARVSRYKLKNKTKLAKFKDDKGKLRVVGKFTRQHYYIRAVKEIFGIELKLKDEDAGAAILLGLSYLRGSPLCDGSDTGGLLPKEHSQWNLKPRI